MFFSYKRLIFILIILFTLIGCAGLDQYIDPYKSLRTDYYDINNFNQTIVNEFNPTKQEFVVGTRFKRLSEQEFLDAIKLAEQGDADAQYKIGLSYLLGYPAKDEFKAGYWIRKSAEQRNPYGQVLLAHLYRYGVGVPHNSSQELFWYTKAAENGNNYAKKILGYKYLYGIGVSRNYNKAIAWVSDLAYKGDLSAKQILGTAMGLHEAYSVSERELNRLAIGAATGAAVGAAAGTAIDSK